MTKISEQELREWLRKNPDMAVQGEDSQPKEDKPHKYRARRVKVDGHTFDSTREAYYYTQLKTLEDQGHIQFLDLQPRFVLQEKFTDAYGNNHRAITYKADFKFYDKKLGQWIVVDVKGYETAHFKDKKKLFLYLYSHKYIYEIWR